MTGGIWMQGLLRVGHIMEVRPGITDKDDYVGVQCTQILSRITSLFAGKNKLQFAVPGGLVGVGTFVDPALTRADRLVGQVLGEVGNVPDVFMELEKQRKVSKQTRSEVLMVNIGSMSKGACVIAVRNDFAKLQLNAPVCTRNG
uniref:Initiation factor eIF2 gamma C-terminal domain-containing protein n=1 Tax=Physcomitrium patens TaxID=3218 RepID=A0A2K1JVA1_PHYPA|nr:hypothetical protein PHYPA_015216 [Physcomitrium patens]